MLASDGWAVTVHHRVDLEQEGFILIVFQQPNSDTWRKVYTGTVGTACLGSRSNVLHIYAMHLNRSYVYQVFLKDCFRLFVCGICRLILLVTGLQFFISARLLGFS